MATRLFDLSGKVAVVTGGNGGIGLGMARGLADAGAAIAVVGRNAAKSKEAATELAGRGVRAIAVTADVTDKQAVSAMAERVSARTRRHRHPRQQCRHQHPQAAAHARSRRMGQRDRDQPHQRLPVLAGGPSGDEGGRRRQDHQYRLDDVDLRRELCAGLCREQGRHRPVHARLRLRVGGRQHPGQRHPAGLDRHRPDQARPRADRRPA